MKPARRSTPPIPGLYVFPGLLPEDVQGKMLGEIARAGIFRGGKRDQVMFFPSTSTSTSASTSITSTSTTTSTTNPVLASTNQEKSVERKNNSDSNPEFLNKTLHIVEDLLRGKVEDEVFRLLFDAHDSQNTHHHPTTETTHHHHHPRRNQQRRQRQSIINLYPLPQSLSHSSPYNNGITPHVDLPGRYADGIVGVCLGSGVAVGFEEVCLGGDFGGGEGDGEGDGEMGYEGLWGEEEDEEEEDDTHTDADDQNPASPVLERKKPHSPPPPPHPSKSNSTNLRKKKNKKKKKRPTSYEVYLPKGTIYILSGEARWSWMHGIEARGEDLVWDDESGDDEIYSESEGEGECDTDDGDGGDAVDEGREGDDVKDGHDRGGYEDHISEEILEGTSVPGSIMENPRKRKRTSTAIRSKRTRPRTATRILRDTRVSITYRWLKPQPRHEPRKSTEDGDEDEGADGGLGGILLQDPVGEGDDWNVR